MTFFIYENWQADRRKAKLHIGSCGNCKEGQGQKGGTDPAHGRWHGPFSNLSDAEDFQAAMNVQVRNECPCIRRSAGD